MCYYQIITAFLSQAEKDYNWARVVFNEMITRNIPVQLLKITIDDVEIVDEWSGYEIP